MKSRGHRPIGRVNELKIRKVWVRIPLSLPELIHPHSSTGQSVGLLNLMSGFDPYQGLKSQVATKYNSCPIYTNGKTR